MQAADDMMSGMRTTIRIDDELLRRLRLKAAETGRTVGSLIEDAVRVSLEDAESDAVSLPPLPTYGSGGVLPGIDLTSTSALLDAMDADVPLDALR
jgi:hypothetical protein